MSDNNIVKDGVFKPNGTFAMVAGERISEGDLCSVAEHGIIKSRSINDGYVVGVAKNDTAKGEIAEIDYSLEAKLASGKYKT